MASGLKCLSDSLRSKILNLSKFLNIFFTKHTMSYFRCLTHISVSVKFSKQLSCAIKRNSQNNEISEIFTWVEFFYTYQYNITILVRSGIFKWLWFELIIRSCYMVCTWNLYSVYPTHEYYDWDKFTVFRKFQKNFPYDKTRRVV